MGVFLILSYCFVSEEKKAILWNDKPLNVNWEEEKSKLLLGFKKWKLVRRFSFVCLFSFSISCWVTVFLQCSFKNIIPHYFVWYRNTARFSIVRYFNKWFIDFYIVRFILFVPLGIFLFNISFRTDIVSHQKYTMREKVGQVLLVLQVTVRVLAPDRHCAKLRQNVSFGEKTRGQNF